MSSVAFRLLAITPAEGDVRPGLVDAWLGAGAAEVGIAVLLRSPGVKIGALQPRYEGVVGRCRAEGIPLLLSCEAADLESLSLSKLGLHGAQLRGDPDEETIGRARMKVGNALLGRSVHQVPPPAAVNYTVFAPVFDPKTPQTGIDKKPKGLVGLADICEVTREPVFALGGVDAKRGASCLGAGAFGLAGISAFFGRTETVVETVSAFVAALRDGKTP